MTRPSFAPEFGKATLRRIVRRSSSRLISLSALASCARVGGAQSGRDELLLKALVQAVRSSSQRIPGPQASQPDSTTIRHISRFSGVSARHEEHKAQRDRHGNYRQAVNLDLESPCRIVQRRSRCLNR